VKSREVAPVEGRVSECHVATMRAFSLKPALAAVFAAKLLAGCAQTVREGKYATDPRGGWDNFRAQAPAMEPARSPGA
jgi:hypothetical protein